MIMRETGTLFLGAYVVKSDHVNSLPTIPRTTSPDHWRPNV